MKKVTTAERIANEQTAVTLVTAPREPKQETAPTAEEVKAATINHQTVVKCLRETAGTFLKLSRALFSINSQRQYKALGFKSWETYLKSQDVNFSVPQSKGYIRLGRMLSNVPEYEKLKVERQTYTIEVTDEEMIACGYSSMLELSRLAQTPDMLQDHLSDIVDYINMRANGRITHAKLKVEIDDILGVSKDGKGGSDGTEGAESGNNDALDITNYPEWKRSILKMVSTAPDFNNFMASLKAFCDAKVNTNTAAKAA